MSAAHWRAISLKAIHEALATLPPDADEKTKRKAISAAYPWYERSHYPYLIWRQEVQKFFGTYKPENRKKYQISPNRQKGIDERRIEAWEAATGKKWPG